MRFHGNGNDSAPIGFELADVGARWVIAGTHVGHSSAVQVLCLPRVPAMSPCVKTLRPPPPAAHLSSIVVHGSPVFHRATIRKSFVISMLGISFHARPNWFERFRPFWELFSRFKFEICRRGNYFEK